MTTLLIFIANFLVGICVGLTSIAGFLLPMFYTGFLSMPSTQSLALSFSAFVASSLLASINYHRTGHLDLKTGLLLSAGSLPGAVFGVKINLLIPEAVIRTILYLVVLGSGISILLRMLAEHKRKNRADASDADTSRSPRSPLFFPLLGLVTGAVCAASGAGGPVLVMPLLTLLGVPAHTAAGVSLFNSFFIALPAAAGYLLHEAANPALWALLPAAVIGHGAGVFLGSLHSTRINQNLLKLIVASGSVIIACIKLFL